MHLQHGQACNNEKQDNGCGGPAAIVEILVKGVIDENPLCGGCPAGASGSVHIRGVQQLHGGDYAHDQLDKNHKGNVQIKFVDEFGRIYTKGFAMPN